MSTTIRPGDRPPVTENSPSAAGTAPDQAVAADGRLPLEEARPARHRTWPWQRAFFSRAGYPSAARREHAAEQARRQLDEEVLRTMLRAGVTHQL